MTWTLLPIDSRYELHPSGKIRSVKTKRVRKLQLKQNGYLGLVFTHVDRKPTGHDFHSLMALTFLGFRPEKHDVSHIDGNRLNNSLNNLCYESRAANVCRVSSHKSGYTRMTAARVRKIRSSKIAAHILAERYGISKTQVWRIKRRIAWSNLL